MIALIDKRIASWLLAAMTMTVHAADVKDAQRAQSVEATPSSKQTGKGAARSLAPNLDFLEYLGTLENEEENWTDVVNVTLPESAKSKDEAGNRKAKPDAATKQVDNAK